MAAKLPEFVQPMLARLGELFESDEHLYEVKWDGIRSLTFVDGGGYRMRSRTKTPQESRYPELAFLARLPQGTLLDGELVVLKDGRPSFREVMRREQARGSLAIQRLARDLPVVYVVFDVLYAEGHSVMDFPLRERRELLTALVEALGEPAFVLSEGVVGDGRPFFEEIQRREVEGIVAKHLESPYLPGRRGDAWTKIKQRRSLFCLVLGYVKEGSDVRSLLIAADFGDGLRSIGRVGSGLTARIGAKILASAHGLERGAPLVPCEDDAIWIEPALYCKVSYLELTEGGNLRAPVFEELIVDDHA